MPNGKGQLECCYCEHFQGDHGIKGYQGAYDSGTCTLWGVQIPSTAEYGEHRICTRFSPNEEFVYEGVGIRDGRTPDPWFPQTVNEWTNILFARFGASLRPGSLYVFSYAGVPKNVRELMRLTDEWE